jgi:hypothetical protein
MLITVDNQTAVRLLRIYGINCPVADERLLAHHDADTGIPVTIDGVADPQYGPSIRLKIAGRRSMRASPITEMEAQALVDEFHAEQLLADHAADRTLVQLLQKCSKLYQDSGISELHLVVYLTPQGYRTHAVYMLRTRNVVIRRRQFTQNRAPADTP